MKTNISLWPELVYRVIFYGENYKNTLRISSLYVCMVNIKYLFNFVETPRKFIIAELSIRKLGSSSVLIIQMQIVINSVLLALMKIRAYGSKTLQ